MTQEQELQSVKSRLRNLVSKIYRKKLAQLLVSRKLKSLIIYQLRLKVRAI
jgi:hypothetical protein